MTQEAAVGGKHETFALLDALRGIAAGFVGTRHTWAFCEVFYFKSFLAVDLVIILSGFVICHAYGQRLEQGALSVRGFMKIRLVRLYPVYFLASCVSVAAIW